MTTAILSCLTTFTGQLRSHAQVAPPITADTTLGTEASLINITHGSATTHTITGGALRDATLFHSFDQFSIPTGDRVLFANTEAISNIISRVTGNNLSFLDGTLQANGSANVFLINPNGIVIGPSAQLQLGGSFFASAGEGVEFNDGAAYRARSPERPPLLNISAPIGLVLGDAPGRVQALASTLSVAEGQTISLHGGDIDLQGTQLTAPNGRIELNSPGNISLTNQSVLETTGAGGGAIQLQGEIITLSDASALISDTLGDQNGDGIHIVADQLTIENGSFVGASTSGTGASSTINIVATEDIAISGVSFADFFISQSLVFTGGRQISDRQTGGLFSFTTGPGRSGDISLQAPNITLTEGATVSAETIGTGRSGDINLTAPQSIRLNASGIYAQSLSRVPLLIDFFVEGRFTQTPTGLSTQGTPAGASGDITLRTAQLRLEDNSVVSASTVTDNTSGTLTVQATDSVVLRETSTSPQVLSSFLASVSIGGNGAAGNTLIETGRLVMQSNTGIYSSTGNFTIPFGGPAGDITIIATESVDIDGSSTTRLFPTLITSSSRSASPAGEIQIVTPTLSIIEAGVISSETFDAGQGGSIQIDASEIFVSGRSILENGSVSGIFTTSGDRGPIGNIPFIGGPATGSAGNISLNTQNLLVDRSATISVASSELGDAGNLDIIAESVRLSEGGSLTASTISGVGGNIVVDATNLTLDDSSITAAATRDSGGNLSIKLQEALLLRQGSLISTEAGTAGAGGNGGDISLNTAFVVAVPSENSDIRANAFEGNGGNVAVTARNLFGINFRPDVLDTPKSDITASSLFGRNGEVVITELNPSTPQSDSGLPVETAPPAVAYSCRGPRTQPGRFISSGRGGLPISPVSPMGTDDLWQDLAPLALPASATILDQPSQSSMEMDNATPEPGATEPAVEARQWRRDADGVVTLFAQSAESGHHLAPQEICLGRNRK
ncbi:MAG: filamentous hemagglutinin N-terminal domain-containing protein [Cyanobacteria bacterium J06632_3]